MELEFLQGRDVICSDWMLADSARPHHLKTHTRKANYYYTQTLIYT